ncbi:LapA family protein [Desulforamulus aeronauticus]|uniref:Lipopolysaccharide assembly protein A domain-containing protein n=1 Tax=Desulforamulus aeronauticus DSM 10349 TaxID=1121421 RepID=A0A1M6U7M6_9FIRM|nr:LapA family protein [Desulforamulus aeronauticus]SHK65156.1 Protein of unknown function [Desulforamulus aeronauticus DSM 10349]
MRLYFGIATVFSILVAVFAIQNSELISIKFLLWQLPGFPLAFVILGAALSGMVVAWLFSIARQYKISKQYGELKNYTHSLEQELLKYRPNRQEKG